MILALKKILNNMKMIFVKNSLFAAAFFILAIVLPSRARAAEYTVLSWFGTQTLTKENSPYLLLSGCAVNAVPAGNTLTIEAGVVIKFVPTETCGGGRAPGQLLVYGNLIVKGTAIEPVVFTSWYDDSAGGDTNGDGDATAPQPGNWGRVQFGSSATSNVSIEHAQFRYGGNESYGMVQVWFPINSIYLNELDIAFSSGYGLKTFVPLAIHNSRFSQNRYTALHADGLWVLGIIDATNNWWGDDSGPRIASNPGGTGQTVTDNVLYDPWIGKVRKLDPVIIIPGILGSAEKNGEWLIDPIFHTYDDLIDTLKANGYTEDKDLFVFPYNWRQSNVLTAFQLHQKIEEIKQICQCDKVDLVGHSMGGLVARQYAQSDYYANDIDQLIFLGTPHLGAPMAYLAWEGGETGINFEDIFLKLFLTWEGKKLGFSNLFDYSRNNPINSVQELLPIYDYLRDTQTGLLRSYPENYPRNDFLESLNDSLSDLLVSDINIINIVGDAGASSTINFLRVDNSSNLPLWEHGYPEEFYNTNSERGLEWGDGDKTVPALSADIIVTDSNKISASHRLLPSEAEGLVFKKLTNKEANPMIHRWVIPNIKFFIIKLFSPVDMVVVAPDGKRIGKDFASGQEVDEIDGAFYSGFLTDDEYVTIPNPLDGEYRVETIGTGNGGGYTVAVGIVSDNGSNEQDFTAITTLDMVTELNVSINSASSTIDIAPADNEPPIITIGSPEARNYTRADTISVVATSTDLGTGLLSQELRFDDRIVNDGDVIDLFFERLGNHALSATSSDFVGNVAASTTNFRIIATPESTISDIKRCYELGWIASEEIKESLIQRLKAIIRFKEKKNVNAFLQVFMHQLEQWRREEIKESLMQHFKAITQFGEKKNVNAFLQVFPHQLEQWYKAKLLNENAYNLLIEDIDWLLNN